MNVDICRKLLEAIEKGATDINYKSECNEENFIFYWSDKELKEPDGKGDAKEVTMKFYEISKEYYETYM